MGLGGVRLVSGAMFIRPPTSLPIRGMISGVGSSFPSFPSSLAIDKESPGVRAMGKERLATSERFKLLTQIRESIY